MEQTMELTVIDKSLEVFKGGSAILVSHKSRAEKALKVAGSILDQWNMAYSYSDPEQRKSALAIVDKRSNDFLANCGVAKTEMEESRKAITQLMDVIKKMFTEEESRIDPKKSEQGVKIQTNRNKYAAELIEQKKRDDQAAELKAAKGKESAEIRAYIKNAITQNLLSFLADKKQAITNSFNAIHLENFVLKSEGLKNMSCVFQPDKLEELIKYKDPAIYVHTQAELNSIKSDEREQYNFNSFFKEYNRQLTELKQSLIDKLPSKQEELLEQKRIADEAEAARIAEVKRQQEAERIRQEQIAKANKAQKEKLEKEAAIAREQEALRLKEMQEAAAKREAEAAAAQLQREQQEGLRLQQEAEAAKK